MENLKKFEFLNNLKISSKRENIFPSFNAPFKHNFSAVLHNVVGYRLRSDNVSFMVEKKKVILKRGSYMLLNTTDGDHNVNLYNSEVGKVPLLSIRKAPLSLCLRLMYVKGEDEHPMLLVGYYDGTVRYFSLPEMKELRSIQTNGNAIRIIRIVDKGVILTAGWYEGKIMKVKFDLQDKGEPNPIMLFGSSAAYLGDHMYRCEILKKKRNLVAVYAQRVVIIDWKAEKIYKKFDEKINSRQGNKICPYSLSTYICPKTKKDRILCGFDYVMPGIAIYNIEGEEINFIQSKTTNRLVYTASLVINNWSFLLGGKDGNIYSLNLLDSENHGDYSKCFRKELDWSEKSGDTTITRINWIDRKRFVFGIAKSSMFGMVDIKDPKEFFDRLAGVDEDMKERIEFLLEKEEPYKIRESDLRVFFSNM